MSHVAFIFAESACSKQTLERLAQRGIPLDRSRLLMPPTQSRTFRIEAYKLTIYSQGRSF